MGLKTVVLFGCLAVTSMGVQQMGAQQKTARSYYEEAKHAGALPSLPYVCFRTSGEMSIAPDIVAAYTDPTFVMLGRSQQIAATIRSRVRGEMSAEVQKRIENLQSHDWLFMEGFDHGINGASYMFSLTNPNDPSRADWVYQSTGGDHQKPYTWDFNINWGTLRFRETLTMESDSLTYYGQCEKVSK